MADTPEEYLSPKWGAGGHVHNWRTHVPEEIIDMWDSFTDEQKAAIARWADEMASNEHWE